MKFIFILLLQLFSMFILSTSFAQVDPAIDWKVQEDDRAIWIYDSRHRALVEQYAKNFRRLLPEIQSVFHELPEKTTFVISDFTDRPNGSATVFPYPLITIYPVIPLPNSPIGETDDSLYEILAHEYTHILNLHPVHGGMRALSWVFGSIVRPNGYLPRWYTEGLAVFTESYFTPRGGRLRSQNFEGMARAISLDKQWNKYPIDTLNDFEPDWLGGRRAYLLGGALLHELATTHGTETIDELNQTYSRRIPYFINGPVDDKTQKDYAELLATTYKKLQSRTDEQVQTLSSSTVSQGAPLKEQGFFNSRPAASPDGSYLAMIVRDHNVPTALHLRKRNAQSSFLQSEPVQIAFGVDISDIAWSPDSQKIAYNSVENFKRFYEYSDIRVYDVKSKKTSRLTAGARAGDLTFSASGDAIYFVQNTPGSKRLARLNLAQKSITTIYTPLNIGTNLYSLVIEGEQLYFVEQYAEKRSLKALHLTSKAVTTVQENILISSLRKTARGYLVTSSQSGVDNLYLVDSLSTPEKVQLSRPITNSLTRILDGDIDPIDGTLYFSEQKSDGQFVFSQSLEAWQQITQAPKVPPLLTIPDLKQNSLATTNEPLAFAEKEEDFSPWPYLWPRYWMPFANVLDGGISFTASTGSADPLGKNAYNLMAEWDTLTERTGVTAGYVNNSTPVTIGLSASQVYRYNYTTESALRDTSGIVSGSYNIPFMFRTWNLGLSWRTSETELRYATFRRSGPLLSLGFNNAIQRGYEISPETGMSASLSHQSYIESLGNIGYDKTNVSLKTYFSRWLPEHNVLFFQLNGTYAPELERTGNIRPIDFYTSTLNGNFFNNLLIPPFLLRGYNSGTLLGYNMLAANLEYRFPISRVFRGRDTIPFFIKRLHGAVVSDVVSLDGLRFSNRLGGYRPDRFGDSWYLGYGAELNVECTLGYYIPVTLSFGVYRGDDRDVAVDDLSYFFVFRL
jgi:dipeptidyl aminopeptidase/acylaminoacyl peptidase